LRQKFEGFADRARRDHLVGEADLGQHMHAVGGDLQAAADPGRIWPRLEQLDVKTCSLQEDCGDRAGDTGADDEGFAGALRHTLLHVSGWARKISG